MEIKKAFPGTKVYRDVKELYYSAFASEERLPFTRMTLLNVLKRSVDLLAYYDGEIFCGFSFTVCTDAYLYINYFAVNPVLRGRGYGTRMLKELRARSSSPALCDVKVPGEESAECEQDIRRIAFWKKNGFDFFDNKITITNSNGVKYFISSTSSYNRNDYWAIFDHLSFGPKAQLRILKNRIGR